MKNVRVKVIETCPGVLWRYAICEGRKQLMITLCYTRKGNTIRAAKKMAKRIGIPYDPEIIKMHGC